MGQHLWSCNCNIFIVFIIDVFNEFCQGLKSELLYLCLGSQSSALLG